MKSKIRKFRHKDGFGDDTRWLEVKDGKVFIVNKEYKRKETKAYTLNDCIALVDKGSWVEY